MKGLALFSCAAAMALPCAAQASECSDLVGAKIAHVTVLTASAVPAGSFQPPAMYGYSQPEVDLPPHCRVRAVAAPVAGSRIGMEIWLPLPDAWDGRFRMYGNGGYSSDMPMLRLAGGLRAGAIVAATDTGHQGDDPDFAVGLPQSLIDWGHRAVHETAMAAKAFAAAYYGSAPRHSYFDGCSTGGHQALMEAQRYPTDFDGIVAGAPGNYRTHLNIGFLWQFAANHRKDGDPGPILAPSKLPLVTREVLRQCGTPAEQAQGWLADPFQCHPDYTQLRCTAGASETCLSDPEVGALQRMAGGATNPHGGAQLYPPWLPGSESIAPAGMPLPGWSLYWSDPRDPDRPARESFFKFWAGGGSLWNWRSFDFDRDVARIDATLAPLIDATDPDLRAFRDAGGKLIQYHGLMDPVVSPWDSRRYYDAVAAGPAGAPDSFYRLFFAPGMGHCGGGPGVTSVAVEAAITDWVEHDAAPEQVPADMADKSSAKLCRYPEIGICTPPGPGK
ncbi:tannase/feruloyl esterase family alpha/beta hydrolase [Sphingosinithalassobacter portus]|uniref:tannase/feruloyl esterase family alpha/beta hydrolase n=1 Tax=Stakelama portus TaxID=2676234 RepID=UPI000D6DF11A|nr:tannase/feruloyl esterase family alpha/beta hydrolase [Sphingosinithalassobacter portus]